jgi:hypothetical protein
MREEQAEGDGYQKGEQKALDEAKGAGPDVCPKV